MRSTLPLIVSVHPIELDTYGVWYVTDGDEISVLAVIDDHESIREALRERLNTR